MRNGSRFALVGIFCVLAVRAQYSTDWQTKAGGKMAFEVASVKPSHGPSEPPNMALTPWDDYTATHGYFRADATLSDYIEFAYKLWPNELQRRELSSPSDRYNTDARAATANPTKDQMRLMMQSLLAERFQLAAHFEAREVPVFDLTLVGPGKPGPKLGPHAEGPPCDKAGASPGDGLPGFPADCHSLSAIAKPGTLLVVLGSRDVTLEMMAGAFSMIPSEVGRLLIDKTGLEGASISLWNGSVNRGRRLGPMRRRPRHPDRLRSGLYAISSA